MTTRKRSRRTAATPADAAPGATTEPELADLLVEGEDYRCDWCDYKYGRAVVVDWGIDGIGSGYGPSPICTHLVPDRGKPQDGPLHVCRGPLVPNV